MSTKKQRPNLINPKGKKIGGITIDCVYDALVDTEDLRPNLRNPNKHPQKQLALLSKIIKAQGFRNPIIVSTLSGYVVKGHARLESARILGLKQCPVDYQDYQTEADEWADMVADNRLAELSDLSLPDLKDLLQELDTGAFDMDLTGFDAESLEDLMTQFHVPEDNKDIDEEAMKDTKNECPKCGFRW